MMIGTAAQAQLLTPVDLSEWHPLSGIAIAPEYIPERWDGIHVGLRLVEALRVLRHMPMAGRSSSSCWPVYTYDWADLLAQRTKTEAELLQEQREQNRTRIQPSSIEIMHMEAAIGWPPHYLFDFTQLLGAVTECAAARSVYRDIEWVARKRLRLPPRLVRAWNREGLDKIAAGLRVDRVAVY